MLLTLLVNLLICFPFFFSETPTGNGGAFLERPEFSGKQKFRPGEEQQPQLEILGSYWYNFQRKYRNPKKNLKV